MSKKKTVRKRQKLTPAQMAEKARQREHIRQIRTVFRNVGFEHISEMESKDLEFEGAKTDFDDFFIHENVIVIVEYTISNESNVGDHLLKKNFVFSKINDNQEKFVTYLKNSFPEISVLRNSIYNDHHFRIVILYASRYNIKPSTKQKSLVVRYFDYAYVKYFLNVTNTVRKSAKFELLEFLGVHANVFGLRAITPQNSSSVSYEGSILPESNSHFPHGYKIVSFYVDPAALLERSYVLRRDGWRMEGNIYQRMISKTKIAAIRKHLLDKKGVFINNIIVTLPANTKLLNDQGDTIDTSNIKKTTPGKVLISSGFNSIGIVDGQHRVFSYYEGGPDEVKISTLRVQQNLLATGIMFPEGISDLEKAVFEARLFLDINSNQSSAKAELKQEIGLILKPFSTDSIARAVLNRINDGNGPLGGEFQRYFWEKNKIKTTTVVSYGLRPLVRLRSEEGLYRQWPNPRKDELSGDNGDEILLNEYIVYCVKELGTFVNAAKSNLPDTLWTTEKNVDGRLLTTTIINGMIACLRQLAIHNKMGDFNYYRTHLSGLEQFPFKSFKSSNYNNMGIKIANQYFGVDYS